jgi:hypothetical protein
MEKNNPAGGTVAERLLGLGVKRGILLEMARNGQIPRLKCEMPICYRGDRRLFDPWPNPRSAPGNKWSPNLDHYPELDKDGGERKPWNVRLAHVHCNSMDRGLRSRIRAMLEKDPSLSFKEIAARLTRRHSIEVPPPYESWTAGLVRKACVS